MTMRDEVALIIDPESIKGRESYAALPGFVSPEAAQKAADYQFGEAIKEAYAKADAILALSPPEPTANVDEIALEAARLIEVHFARSHRGGATQRRARVQCIVIDAIKRAMPLQDHGKATVRHEDVLSDARSAVQKWADWCHQNEAQWSGWGDMVIPQGATVWTEAAEKVLASFPAMVAEQQTEAKS